MWAYESVFYQIYPLGFCGAPFEQDNELQHRILKVIDWIPHLNTIGINAIYFSPVFDSDTHGYNTRDYLKIDPRLGTNEDFLLVCNKLHEHGIKVVLDGVFNHVGRGFWAFQDVLVKREASQYKDWFYRIDFGGNSHYNDGLWYEGWEGNYDLVKLNLKNPEVKNHIFEAVDYWKRYFGIDGLRLDVAYSLDENFVKELRNRCDSIDPNFFLLGEMLHGDYNRMMNQQMLHSVTNYECYKGLYSSFNSYNLFEIMHSLNRQFSSENWTLYKNKHLLSFVDNHDVTRVASVLEKGKHIPLIYLLCFTMPGIPCIYYGSEWGQLGDKRGGDQGLRPCFEQPIFNELSSYIATLTMIKRGVKALQYGSFKVLALTNRQCVFERVFENERVIIGLNIDEQPFDCTMWGEHLKLLDLMNGREITKSGPMHLDANSGYIWKVLV